MKFGLHRLIWLADYFTIYYHHPRLAERSRSYVRVVREARVSVQQSAFRWHYRGEAEYWHTYSSFLPPSLYATPFPIPAAILRRDVSLRPRKCARLRPNVVRLSSAAFTNCDEIADCLWHHSYGIPPHEKRGTSKWPFKLSDFQMISVICINL